MKFFLLLESDMVLLVVLLIILEEFVLFGLLIYVLAMNGPTSIVCFWSVGFLNDKICDQPSVVTKVNLFCGIPLDIVARIR